MKYNNKLNLVEYFQIIDEIVHEYFDMDTYEYVPQFGELFAICSYYNHCVELEESDDFKIHPIEDIMDMKELLENEDFMSHYNTEINCLDSLNATFTFGHAYDKAMEIVDYKKNDANSFANAIGSAINAILTSFRESFSDEEIEKFTTIAQQVVDGKLSNEAIVAAYDKSERFKQNTDELSGKNIIPFPSKE